MRFNIYRRDDVFNERDGWVIDPAKASIVHASLPSGVLDAINDEDMETDFPWSDMEKVLCECLSSDEVKVIGGDCYMLNFEVADDDGDVFYIDIEDSHELYLNLNKDIGVENYVSPRRRELSEREQAIRDCAYKIKQGDMNAIRNAAMQMASHVNDDSILIPLPSSDNDTTSNLLLARAIADLSGSDVVDMLYRSKPVESSSKRRIDGHPGLSPVQHYIEAHKPEFELDVNKVVFIDNVITSGATGHAAKVAVGGGRVLAYAFAKEEAQSQKIDIIMNDELTIDCNVAHHRSYTGQDIFSFHHYVMTNTKRDDCVGAVSIVDSALMTVVNGELYEAHDDVLHYDDHNQVKASLSPKVHIDACNPSLAPYLDLLVNTALTHKLGKPVNYPVLDASQAHEIAELKSEPHYQFEGDEFTPMEP